MVRTAFKWMLAGLLSVIGFFISGVLVVGYVNGTNSLGGLISGIVMGAVFYIPGIIFLILALIDVGHQTFDRRIANLLEKYDRITPKELAEKANTTEEKVERSVSRILADSKIIVFFDQKTGEYVTEEGKAIAERVIGIIQSKRRITLYDLCQETRLMPEEVKRIVVAMKKRGLFQGTYDWKTGKILSKEGAEQLTKAITLCPYCGGELSEPPLPGEEIKCEYCGKLVTGK